MPDPDDRHVLACAIQTNAAVIVTDNLKDFPSNILNRYGISTISIDNFIADTLDLANVETVVALKRMRERFEKPEMNPEELILRIKALGLTKTSDILAKYKQFL